MYKVTQTAKASSAATTKTACLPRLIRLPFPCASNCRNPRLAYIKRKEPQRKVLNQASLWLFVILSGVPRHLAFPRFARARDAVEGSLLDSRVEANVFPTTCSLRPPASSL